MTRPLLDIRNLSKTFPGVRALDGVSLHVNAGEIVALLGHNGSGKSTLVKVLAGVHRPDDGSQILVRGSERHSDESGLHFIHQDLGLVPTLNTVENLDLGIALHGRAVRAFHRRNERARARRLLAEFGADVDVTAPISGLSPADRTVIAIARALSDWSSPDNVLILDEPTAALHGEEVAKLFEAIRRVAARGAGIVFISHRLEEVVDLADRVVVLRNGKVVAERERGTFDHASLVDIIAGGVHTGADHRANAAQDQVRLSVTGLTGPQLNGVDFTVRAGEVLGVSGLLGSGVDTLAGCLFGALQRDGGRVVIDGVAVPSMNPAAAIRAGAALVPSDRRRHGAVVTMTARENITLPSLRPLRRALGRIDARAEHAEAQNWMDSVGALPSNSVNRSFSLFSGGNQQKIVLAKWLRNSPTVLLLQEPTQGVDVGAQAGIYALIQRAAHEGTAVLVTSSDTDELAALCDRVLVLRNGRVLCELHGTGLTEEALVRATLSDEPHPMGEPVGTGGLA
jgi:ribose transport system ATP-binding protein